MPPRCWMVDRLGQLSSRIVPTAVSVAAKLLNCVGGLLSDCLTVAVTALVTEVGFSRALMRCSRFLMQSCCFVAVAMVDSFSLSFMIIRQTDMFVGGWGQGSKLGFDTRFHWLRIGVWGNGFGDGGCLGRGNILTMFLYIQIFRHKNKLASELISGARWTSKN